MKKEIKKRKRRTKAPLDNLSEAVAKVEASKQEIAKISNNGKKPVEKKISKPKRMPTRRALYIALSISCFLFGIGSFALYFTTLNQMWGFVMIPFLGVGSYFFYLFRRQHEQVNDLVTYGNTDIITAANGLSIYPAEKGGIKFENYSDKFIKDLIDAGANPRRCVNDNKPYFVTIWENNKLANFTLPDQQYYDPRVFGERVLQLPAHQKLFARKQNLLQKLSPFILLLVLIIEWILIITTTTPKGG